MNIKRLIPGFIKSLIWYKYLRIKYRKHNKIGRRVKIAKDVIIGRNCKIGDNVVLGNNVILGNEVIIGTSARLERVHIGDNSVVEGRVIITGFGDGMIKIGKESFVGHNTVLDFSDNITIGNYVHIGYSQFWTHSSALMCLNSIALSQKGKKYRPTSPIVIEDNVYIGVQSTIYPGVKIGHHSIVAPNSAVTKNVEPFTMVGGVPAKKIKDLRMF
ncbi:MAG: hypothetical protein MUO72_14480 [Bacteroidales bacterium]|nr:hypothetical protein [Bacteroidales bacterium]